MAMERVKGNDLGISIRLIRQFDVEADRKASMERMRAEAELWAKKARGTTYKTKARSERR